MQKQPAMEANFEATGSVWHKSLPTIRRWIAATLKRANSRSGRLCAFELRSMNLKKSNRQTGSLA
jgi:hypothetical protein